ncbi:MAG: ATP-binding protein, partial [Thermoguttaceae bacterium]
EFGIIPAIENLVAGKSDAGRPEIELVCRGHVPRLARPLENAVFRIVQETLANACRYSESDRVRVELSRNERELCLSVQDWGVGFEPHRVGEDRFGLRGVTERARLLGGSAKIESAAGKGTHIRVTLPLVVSADDDRHRLEETLEAKRRRGDVEE